MSYSEAFEAAFSETMTAEGGYVLHNVAGDRGGITYAGISRVKNQSWPGWAYIDRKETPPTSWVRSWYHEAYWVPIKGDELLAHVSLPLFKAAVNTSAAYKPVTAIKLAQIAVGVAADGDIGPKTLSALNNTTRDSFALRFLVAQWERYMLIIKNDQTQMKFARGWWNRVVKGLV